MVKIDRYQKAWINRRKNPPRNGGKPTVSYTLEWREHGRRRFKSLGSRASYEYARRMAALKEKEDIWLPTGPERTGGAAR